MSSEQISIDDRFCTSVTVDALILVEPKVDSSFWEGANSADYLNTDLNSDQIWVNCSFLLKIHGNLH